MCAGQKWMTKNKVQFQLKNFHDTFHLSDRPGSKRKGDELPDDKLLFLENNLATILEEKTSKKDHSSGLITNEHRDEDLPKPPASRTKVRELLEATR